MEANDLFEQHPYRALPHRAMILVALSTCIGFGVALWAGTQNQLLLWIATLGLTMGLLIIVLGTDPRCRATIATILLAGAPLIGILKPITGTRYAPLIVDVSLAALLGIWLVQSTLRNRSRLGTIDVIWLFFIALSVAQIANPNVPGLQAGIEGFRKFAYASLAFILARHVLTHRHVLLLRNLLIILSVPISLYAIKQFYFPSSLDLAMIDLASASRVTYMMGRQLRPFSTLPGPFHLGLYLVVVELALLSIIIARKDVRRWVSIAVFALNLVALLFTRTKGCWIALIISTFFLVGLQKRSLLGFSLPAFSLATVAWISYALILDVTSGNANSVLQEAVGYITNPLSAPTLQYRLMLWRDEMLPALLAKPFIGYGTSSAGEGLRQFYEGVGGTFHFLSHNLYLKVTLELGLPGLGFFAMIIVPCFLKGLGMCRRVRGRSDASGLLAPWATACIVAFLVGGLVIPVLDAYPANYYFWLLLGYLTQRGVA